MAEEGGLAVQQPAVFAEPVPQGLDEDDPDGSVAGDFGPADLLDDLELQEKGVEVKVR